MASAARSLVGCRPSVPARSQFLQFLHEGEDAVALPFARLRLLLLPAGDRAGPSVRY